MSNKKTVLIFLGCAITCVVVGFGVAKLSSNSSQTTQTISLNQNTNSAPITAHGSKVLDPVADLEARAEKYAEDILLQEFDEIDKKFHNMNFGNNPDEPNWERFRARMKYEEQRKEYLKNEYKRLEVNKRVDAFNKKIEQAK